MRSARASITATRARSSAQIVETPRAVLYG
jgi:hypothetical protein